MNFSVPGAIDIKSINFLDRSDITRSHLRAPDQVGRFGYKNAEWSGSWIGV